MNQTRKHQKRALRIKLTLIYTFMVLCVVTLVAGLYLVIQGYRFNRYDGQIQQGGLVQFNSVPGSASIWLDGQQLASRTQSRLTISPGTHKVSMWREGYNDWNKTVTVVPGQVLWLHYVRLVPKVLEVTPSVAFAGATKPVFSYDGKAMVAVEDAKNPVISLVNVDTDTPKKVNLTLPVGAYTQSDAHTFEVVSWAYDNKYILIKHNFSSGTEWITLDTTNPVGAKNITKLLGVEATDIQYSKDDANTLFTLTVGGDVRKLNVDQKTITGPLVQNVDNFNLYDSSTVVYTSKPDAAGARALAYLTVGAQAPRVVAQYTNATSSPMQLRITKYYGAYYLACIKDGDIVIMTGDLSASDAHAPQAFKQYATAQLSGGAPQFVGVSPDEHRFMYAQNATGAVVYDLDAKSAATITFSGSVEQRLAWVDPFHFTVAQGADLSIMDYDGTNAHTLVTAATSGASSLVQNGKYLYSTQLTPTGSHLVRVKMLVN